MSDDEHNEAVGRFLEAMATGDLDAIIATLHPDALVMGDANGTTNTAVNVIHGAEKFARFYLGLMKRYGEGSLDAMFPVLVNGQLGVATLRLAGRDQEAQLAAASRWVRGPRRQGVGDVRHRQPREARRRQAP